MDLTKLDLAEAAQKIKNREITSEELTLACLNKNDETRHLNAFTFVNADIALGQAREVDKKINSGVPVGILAGVPISIKDNICTFDMPTSCGSNMLKGYMAKSDAIVVEKIREQDGIIIGKANLDEFAMGSGSFTSAFGRVLHPLKADCVPGGSSGGSAVSVAIGSSFGSVGSDTGGSVRQPASFCGICGLKPTFGRVSKKGMFPLVPSLDQPGTFTRSTLSTAIFLQAICGQKNDDDTVFDDAPIFDYKRAVAFPKTGLKIGVLKQSFHPLVDKSIVEAFKKVVEFYTLKGFVIEEVDLQNFDLAAITYAVLCCGEAVDTLRNFDGHNLGRKLPRSEHFGDLIDEAIATRGEYFGIEVKKRLLFGSYVKQGENFHNIFSKARKMRTWYIQLMNRLFEKFDIILSPATATTATSLISKSSAEQGDLTDAFQVIANFTGRPAYSIPCGTDGRGLPIGVQFLGHRFAEEELLSCANLYEKEIGHKYIIRP